ncbi:hypothetical protein N7532_002969 [Penicillium argentinense]|uniref:Uncharacterized protein n=1 Tax=Penicillium argentinense TaxID=1131581 RepID=A0A9W9KKQ2_9EURO|nr:uncharacterized protein N7532_002969 [Penicillium argentinense]KAJ5110324.1 hypothetical protein N7532_002969 [Penicillium argentinense]
MKLLIIVNALMVALFSHVALGFAIERSSLTARDDKNGTVSTAFGDVVSSFQPDGKHKIEFYSEGALEVTALEQDDGSVAFYDVDGKVIDLTDIEEDDDLLQKRASKFQLAWRFAKLIAKYGKKAWTFIYCVGTSPFWRCGDEFLDCAAGGRAPWSCPEGGICLGHAIYKHCK